MNKKSLCLQILSILLLSFFSDLAIATKCGDLIYNKHGWLRKYEIINLSLIEGIKKHGTSSTWGATTETTTAASDFGVTTGGWVSFGQSLSTRGECKWGGFFSSLENYHSYIAQNIYEIKREMALGKGGHLEILAGVHSCNADGQMALPKVMQRHLPEFIDYTPERAAEFASTLNQLVLQDLSLYCHTES